ncbi:MAG: AAA family ATPase, partial [Spirochaetales bacterium]|nr:AAA family ATPase [Spirochaetales bacterium]
MSDQQNQHQDRDFIRRLPEWAKTFAVKYRSNTSSTFIFHGNIRDFLSQRTFDDEFKFVKIQDYFADILFGHKGRIICYDRSSGISFIENPYNKYPDETRNDFIQLMIDRDVTASNYKEKEKKLFNRSLTNSFELLESYFYKKLEQKERVVLIIDFAETIIPFTSGTSASEDDRFALVTIKKWAYNPLFMNKDINIILLTENLHEINQTIVKCPNILKVQIPIPNEDIRLNFIKYKQCQGMLRMENSLSAETMA